MSGVEENHHCRTSKTAFDELAISGTLGSRILNREEALAIVTHDLVNFF